MSIFLHSFLGWTEREVGEIPQGNLRQFAEDLREKRCSDSGGGVKLMAKA
jgi:hypothetical protein